jgi:LAGLIDADG endonuclease
MEPTVLAYIAGFLDGDGSIFFQLIRKHDYRLGFQIRPSVAFYQKTENEHILLWLKEQLVSGCLRRRGTGISDYTIVEPGAVQTLLQELQPYVRLKCGQVTLGLEILEELRAASNPQRFLALSRRVDQFRDLNYSKKRTITSIVVEQHLRVRGLLDLSPNEVAEAACPTSGSRWSSTHSPIQ